MKTLSIKEMSCNHCVQRIGALLNELQVKHTISLEDKTVTLDDGNVELEKVIEELDDIGFTATIAE